MAHSETTNTHLHKILTHRNYMHHVSLQKQLNIFDRQKKLVERELLQITKVRETIQQIKEGSLRNSPKIKKRGASPKKLKNDSVMKREKVVEDIKERIEGKGAVENNEEGPGNANGLENETIAQSSMQILSMQRSGFEAIQAAAGEQFQARLPEQLAEIPEKAILDQTTSNSENEKLFIRRRPPCAKKCSESNNLVIPKMEELVESHATNNEQCKVHRSPKTPIRRAFCSKSDENLYRKSLPGNHMNTEIEKTGRKEYRFRPGIAERDRYSNSDENLYKKSLLCYHAAAERKENKVSSNAQSEIYRLSKSSARMNKDSVYSNSDDDLYRSSLSNQENAAIKLPTLSPMGGPELINSSNPVKEPQSTEFHKNNSSPKFGLFSNDVCFVQRSRPRSKTVSDLPTRQPKAAWNSPAIQRKHKESPRFMNTFQNGDICLLDRQRAKPIIFKNKDICLLDGHRARTTAVPNPENSLSEHGRPRSKTEPGFVHAVNQPARDCNDRSGRTGLSEDESIAIKVNPSQLQCLAANNRFLIPRKSDCDPFKSDCRMGDLVKSSIADCELRSATHLRYSLTSSYEVSPSLRCQPELLSSRGLDTRVVGVAVGDPTCMPIERTGMGTFTCGEKGTRCVCDAPDGARNLKKSHCRCQYFVDYCAVPNVCRHSQATCKAKSNAVSCTCPPQNKECLLGINQCSTNPFVCLDDNKECIELHDELLSWSMESSKQDEGYACLHVEDIKFISRSTNYCVLKGNVTKETKGALNYIDICCSRQLKCGADDATGYHGNIMSHRPCHCYTHFRKCLRRYSRITVYRDLVSALFRALDQVKNCQIRDGTACNPKRPNTCRKGDLIDPKYAHCRVNCKTGPLLPIGQRMCSIRQCKPPNFVEGIRIIDVPNRATSSMCEPVRNLPYLCGRGDTRCVCDGKPQGITFTDRCRCQFWPFKL